ncbi:hypothetical protein MRX96_035124 [Rhipicephalus microplus]
MYGLNVPWRDGGGLNRPRPECVGAAFAGCRGPQSDAQRQRSRFTCAGSLRIYRRLLRVCWWTTAGRVFRRCRGAPALEGRRSRHSSGGVGGFPGGKPRRRVSCRAEFPGIGGARLPASHPGNSGVHPSPLSTLPGNRCSCVMTCNRCGGPPLSVSISDVPR